MRTALPEAMGDAKGDTCLASLMELDSMWGWLGLAPGEPVWSWDMLKASVKFRPGIWRLGPIAPISPKAMLGMLLIAPKISGGNVKPAGMGPKSELGEVEPPSSDPGDLGNENDTACVMKFLKYKSCSLMSLFSELSNSTRARKSLLVAERSATFFSRS